MTESRSSIRQECSKATESVLREMGEFRESGGMCLGYLCQGFPASLAAGFGMWPVRMLRGASTEMEDRGGMLVRPDVCPLVKSFLGGVSAGSGFYGMIDVWAGLSTCDQTRRCFAELPHLTGSKVVELQLPSTRTESAERYYRRSAESFCRDLEGMYGLRYDPAAALAHAVERYRAGRVLRRLSLAGTVPAGDMHLMYHLFHVGRPGGLADRLESIAETGKAVPVPRRVGLAGSPLALEDTAVLEAITRAGFGVVPLHCAALQATEQGCERGEPASGDPGDLASDAFLSVRCARSRPNTAMFEWLETMISETGCEGLVVKTMRFCDLWFAERVRFRERIGVPVLVLDTAFSEGERERQTARIEAFVETLC